MPNNLPQTKLPTIRALVELSRGNAAKAMVEKAPGTFTLRLVCNKDVVGDIRRRMARPDICQIVLERLTKPVPQQKSRP